MKTNADLAKEDDPDATLHEVSHKSRRFGHRAGVLLTLALKETRRLPYEKVLLARRSPVLGDLFSRLTSRSASEKACAAMNL